MAEVTHCDLQMNLAKSCNDRDAADWHLHFIYGTSGIKHTTGKGQQVGSREVVKHVLLVKGRVL